MLTMRHFRAELRSILEQLIKLYHPEKVILFGSLAAGIVNEDTDIDLFLIKEDIPELGVERIRQLDNMIRYSLATDFIVYKPSEVEERLQLGDPFLKKIFEEGKVIYEAN